MSRTAAAASLWMLAIGLPSLANAQHFDETGMIHDFETEETWALEFRGGTYQPNAGAPFNTFFEGSQGPLLALEVDFLPIEVHDWFDAGIGFGFGWAQYSGFTLDEGGNATEEGTNLTLYPMPIMAVLRFDGLARQLRVPILVTGKLGADFVIWNSGTGGTSVTTNISVGLRWAVQFALELDIFNPRAARSLDEVWGINHAFFFFEFFGSTASTTLNAGPKDGVAWAVGLGLLF